mgnify:CR=1 FL=1
MNYVLAGLVARQYFLSFVGEFMEKIDKSNHDVVATVSTAGQRRGDRTRPPVTQQTVRRSARKRRCLSQTQEEKAHSARAHLHAVLQSIATKTTTPKGGVAEATRLLIFSGSGLSVGAGLSTFSTEGGLYDKAKRKYGLSNGSELFHYRFYKKMPRQAQAFLAQVSKL